MAGALVPRVRAEIARIDARRRSWVDFTADVADAVRPLLRFDAYCWHTVDPGTILFTGSVNRNVACSGSWLARHEYVIDDINKWSFLAHSGRIAGATSIDTHGDPTRSARHRSHENVGFGDELRVSLVVDGIYWGAAAFLRYADRPWFTEADVGALAALSASIATGLRGAIATQVPAEEPRVDWGPGVVVFDEDGRAESISPAAERWISELVEDPAPDHPSESKIVQSIAARARVIAPGTDPLELAARARARTRSGTWLRLYGTRLDGGIGCARTAVIIHPATPHDVAPLVALSYGLTDRETRVAMQCIQGHATKEIAKALSVSPYTVQDHLKSIFEKTGVRSRGELVGQIFLDHYATRWEAPSTVTPGLFVRSIDTRGT